MDTIECILSRRSCRLFTTDAVSDNDLEILLKCAMQSPTASNRQSWRFLVIREKNLLDRIPGFLSYGKFVSKTPAGILVCGDLSVSPEMWSMDASIAAQSILLAAHAIGLGGCWLAVQPFPSFIKGFRDLCKLPDHIQPHCYLALGHPAEKKSAENRFDPKKVHENVW